MSVPPDADATTPEELLERIALGSHESFAELYYRFSGALLGIATGVTKDDSEAQDVVQESFLSVWKSPGAYIAKNGKVSTWLFTITRNRAIDAIRKRKRIAAAMERSRLEISDPDGPGTPDEAACASDRADQVRRALNGLSPKQREVMLMSYYEGMSQSEIASKLGEPLGTVKARIRRTIKRTRETLGAICMMCVIF